MDGAFCLSHSLGFEVSGDLYNESNRQAQTPIGGIVNTPTNKRVLLVGLAAAVLLLTGCGGGQAASQATPTETPKPDIVKARISCSLEGDNNALLGDAGYTITLQGAPKYSSEGLSNKEIGCFLDAVKTPDSVIGQIDSTRALDGMQKATWDKFAATWTYHPDDGPKIIVTESQ